MSQTTSAAGNPTITKASSQSLRAHFNELVALLDLDEPFTHDDLPAEISAAQLGSWRDDRIVAEVAIEREGGDKWRHWRVTDVARNRLEAIAAQNNIAPCGHRGISNLGDGVYSCAYEACDERFDREAAERIVGGGD